MWEQQLCQYFMQGLRPSLSAAVRRTCIGGLGKARLEKLTRHAEHAQEQEHMKTVTDEKKRKETKHQAQLPMMQAVAGGHFRGSTVATYKAHSTTTAEHAPCAELSTTGLRTVPNVLAATEGVAVGDPREEGDDEEVSINARNINRARARSNPTEKKRGCGRGSMGWRLNLQQRNREVTRHTRTLAMKTRLLLSITIHIMLHPLILQN